jgi:hypothetical protein
MEVMFSWLVKLRMQSRPHWWDFLATEQELNLGGTTTWISSQYFNSFVERRKTWLLGGAILVNLSFFFLLSECFLCHLVSWSEFPTVYYAVLAAFFNFGWASVQVLVGVSRKHLHTP